MKFHPLLRLVATQPQLLADHAEAYAGLVGEELGKTAAAWKLRIVLGVIALGLVVVSAVLGGVAAMLWAVTPAPNLQAPWVLIAAPAVPLMLALGCLFAVRGKSADTFAELKRQLAADLVMLREVSAR